MFPIIKLYLLPVALAERAVLTFAPRPEPLVAAKFAPERPAGWASAGIDPQRAGSLMW